MTGTGTPAMTISRPSPDEYAPGFAGYVGRIGAQEDVLEALACQRTDLLAWLGRIPPARGDHRYAPDKWSIKEVVGHLSDTERVFAYRALRIGRGDRTPLPGYDDQAYVPEQRAADRALADLAEEWDAVRHATLTLLRNLPPAAWTRVGLAGDHPASVRALAYVIAGHVRHHLDVLEARYL
jgi:hypothetical protein